MRNIRKILFLALIGFYAVGICIGSISQVRAKHQGEMYEYLESAVSGYDVTVSESIKSVARDNVIVLLVMLASAFFSISPFVTGGIILFKGYSAGFAITSMLRLYGMKGLLFCGANFISALVLIPPLAYFGGACGENILNNRQDKKLFLKKNLIFMIFITATFCADSLIRGFLSSIFMKLGINV